MQQVQEMFPGQLGQVDLDRFVEAINKVTPGLIRTEADELSYSLHVLIRYEIEKMLIEEDLDVKKLPDIWADKYEEYLGIRLRTRQRACSRTSTGPRGPLGISRPMPWEAPSAHRFTTL